MKIIGHIKMFNNQKTIIGFMIRPIEDFNEVTHHIAETIFAHLAITKGLSLVSYSFPSLSLILSLSLISIQSNSKDRVLVQLVSVMVVLHLNQEEGVGPH